MKKKHINFFYDEFSNFLREDNSGVKKNWIDKSDKIRNKKVFGFIFVTNIFFSLLQALLFFWYQVCMDCPENIKSIVSNSNVCKQIAYNYIL